MINMVRIMIKSMIVMMMITITQSATANEAEWLFVQASKKCYLSFNETGNPTSLLFPDIVVDAAFQDRPDRGASFINGSRYANDFEVNMGITANTSNAAFVGWKGSSPVYTVGILSNTSWDSSTQVLEYSLEQSYSQQGTNIFPSSVKKRARKGKGTTLKLKKCAFFTDDFPSDCKTPECI